MFWLLACNGGSESKSVETVEDTAVVDEMEFVFSIAVLADPHISGNAEHSARLQEAIAWINEHRENRQIELVPVLGDVGWGVGLSESKELLEQLEVPYIPIIGDNEIQYGDEENFTTVYNDQFQWLSENTEAWTFGGGAVWNPEEVKESFFTNMAFTHKGIRLIALDWASRLPSSEGIWTEFGYLHEFEGGTKEFLESELPILTESKQSSTLFLTHIPMTIGSFNSAQMDSITTTVAAYSDRIYANFAGHMHVNVEDDTRDRGYEVYVTNAVWDDVITIRMLDVYQNSNAVYFEQELIEFPWSGE